MTATSLSKQPILDAYGATNIGQRMRNEDFFLIDKNLRLFVVADGMGGHTAGNFASCFASGRIQELFQMQDELSKGAFESTVGTEGSEVSSNSRMSPAEYIEFAIWDANRNMQKLSRGLGEGKSMGTTVVGAFFFANKVYLFNVGDSRCYRIYRGSIQQITTDHSKVERLVSEGELSPEESRTAKGRNVLTRAIGSRKIIRPDIYTLNARIGDRFLLCSDGLSNMIAAHSAELKAEDLCSNDREKKLTMMDFVFRDSIKNVCDGLVDLAKRRGGKDNITAVVVRVVKEGSVLFETSMSEEDMEEVFEQSIPIPE